MQAADGDKSQNHAAAAHVRLRGGIMSVQRIQGDIVWVQNIEVTL